MFQNVKSVNQKSFFNRPTRAAYSAYNGTVSPRYSIKDNPIGKRVSFINDGHFEYYDRGINGE